MFFKATKDRRDGVLYITLSGTMDEKAVLPAPPEIPAMKIVVDVQGVDAINSIGCRSWIAWIKNFEGGHIELERCSPAFLNQANLLVGFLPANVVVGSFYIPYFCETCEFEKFVLLNRHVDFTPDRLPVVPQEIPCPNCRETMALDVAPDRYFRFLKIKNKKGEPSGPPRG